MDSQSVKPLSGLDTEQWRRVSPIAIIYFLIAVIKPVFGNFYVLLPGYFFLKDRIYEQPELWLSVLAGVVIVFLILALLSYYFYQYRLTDGSVEIRSGILQKKNLHLPFERVQNIKLEQPIYYRFADFVCLKLDTAGSAKQEAKVVALPRELAETMKAEILASHAGTSVQEPVAGEVVSEVTETNQLLLISRSISDLVIHGLSSNRVWFLLAGLAPFYDNIADFIINKLSSMGIDIVSYFSTETQSWWQIGLYAISLTMLLMAILALLSVLGSIFTFYGYQLIKQDDKYIRKSGLLTRHEVSMRLSRLQVILRKQDWLDRVLGRVDIKYQQVNNNMQNADPATMSNRIIVPSVTHVQAQMLIDDAYPGNQLANTAFLPISKRYILRWVVLTWLPLFALISAIFWWNNAALGTAVSALVFVVVSIFTVLRWFRWGYAWDDDFVYLRKGYIGVDYLCFPIYKIQQTKYSQSVFMKPHALANIELVSAAGGYRIPFLPQENAMSLQEKSLFIVESSPKSWM